MKHRLTPKEILRKHSLLFGILTSIFLASIYPKFGSSEGPLKTKYTVKYGAVSLIFFISGYSLETHSIFHTFQMYKLHAFIQIFTFLFIPITCQIFVKSLSIFGLNPWILKGLVTVSCMPPPVSSAIVLTRTAKGNETAAIFNSVIGSFLGIILTPILLLFNLGSTAVVPLLSTVIQLSTTVLVPLFLGQILKNFTKLKTSSIPLNEIGQVALIFVIYTTFCDTFLTPETGLTASDIIVTVLAVVVLQVLFTWLSFNIARFFSTAFSKKDVISIVFCSTHKSLTLGVPILRIIFHGYMHLSQITLPLLIYHPVQIILGGLIVAQLRDWAHSQKIRRPMV